MSKKHDGNIEDMKGISTEIYEIEHTQKRNKGTTKGKQRITKKSQ